MAVEGETIPTRCLPFSLRRDLFLAHLEHDSNSWNCYDFVLVKMGEVQFALTLNHKA